MWRMSLLFVALTSTMLLRPCSAATGDVPPPPTKVLPATKTALLEYHLAKYLRAEDRSAPWLSVKNHPHGWQKPDCKECHELAETADLKDCRACHGSNGLGQEADTCQSCHGSDHADGRPRDHVHRAHLDSPSKQMDCASCHPDPEADTFHANGMRDVRLAGTTYTPTPMGSDIGGSCGASSCHEERVWAVDGCTTCHGFPPESGLHAAHLPGAGQFDDDLLCESCHEGYDHRSGLVDVGGFDSYDAATGTCTAACHLTVADRLKSSELHEVEQWGCGSCHGEPPASGNHQVAGHVQAECRACHTSHAHSDAVVNLRDRPSEWIAEVAFETPGEYSDRYCAAACHEAVTWGGSCSQCHGYPPQSGRHQVHVVDEGLTCVTCHAWNQHDLDVDRGVVDVDAAIGFDNMSGTCATQCHSETQDWGCDSCHGFPPKKGLHGPHAKPTGMYWDVTSLGVDVELGLPCGACHADHEHGPQAATVGTDYSSAHVLLADGEYRAETGRCATSCHDVFSWEQRCMDCHGTPPSSGSHPAHAAIDGVQCASCHNTIQHEVSLDFPAGYIDPDGLVQVSVIDPMTGGCETACHVSADGRPETLKWDCASCHGYPPATGAHERHMDLTIQCAVCHAGHTHTAQSVTAPTSSMRADVSLRRQGQYDRGARTCLNAGCHRDYPWEATQSAPKAPEGMTR